MEFADIMVGKTPKYYLNQTPCLIDEKVKTQSYDLFTILEVCSYSRAHEYTLTHVLHFSKFASDFPVERKLQLF
jgi:hypothetical protein